jgi:hypothetical protein
MLITPFSSKSNRFIIIASISLVGLLSANVIGEIGTNFLDLAYLRPSFPNNWHFFLNTPNIPYFRQSLNKWSRSGKYQFFVLYREVTKLPMPLADLVKKDGFSLKGPCSHIIDKQRVYNICPMIR